MESHIESLKLDKTATMSCMPEVSNSKYSLGFLDPCLKRAHSSSPNQYYSTSRPAPVSSMDFYDNSSLVLHCKKTISTYQKSQELAYVETQPQQLNQVTIFGREHNIIAKFTKKVAMDYNFKHERTGEKPSILARILKSFTPYYLITHCNESEEANNQQYKVSSVLSENIAVSTYLAERLKCNFLIDACGKEDSAIQFANTCQGVIVIRNSPEEIEDLNMKAAQTKNGHKIEFLMANYLKVRRMTGNIVFLSPRDIRNDRSVDCLLEKHFEPKIGPYIAKSLEMASSIAIKLPNDIDLEELIKIFHKTIEKDGGYSKRYCIEIEEIIDDYHNLGCFIIYFGKCSSITRKEEFEVIYDYFKDHDAPGWAQKYPLHVMAALIDEIGFFRTLKYITEAEKRLATYQTESFLDCARSLFEVFSIVLIDENMFPTLEKLTEFIEEETKKPPSSFDLLLKKYTEKKANTVLFNKTISEQELKVIEHAGNSQRNTLKSREPPKKSESMNSLKKDIEERKSESSPALFKSGSKDFEDQSFTSYSFQFSQDGSFLNGSFTMTATEVEDVVERGRSITNYSNQVDRLSILVLEGRDRGNTFVSRKKSSDPSNLSDENSKSPPMVSRKKRLYRKMTQNTPTYGKSEENEENGNFEFEIQEVKGTYLGNNLA